MAKEKRTGQGKGGKKGGRFPQLRGGMDGWHGNAIRKMVTPFAVFCEMGKLKLEINSESYTKTWI
jgi:hypothetical protein